MTFEPLHYQTMLEKKSWIFDILQGLSITHEQFDRKVPKQTVRPYLRKDLTYCHQI